MLVKANNVIGLKVVTLETGKEVTKIEDVVYDPRDNMVKALVIDEGGWFSDAKVILFEDIKSIGEDAVIIESEERVRTASEVSSRVANIAREEQNLTKTKIITEEGDELGSVSDIIFDSKTGKVEEFEVSQGAQNLASGKKTIRVNNIITVGEDATIVSGVSKQVVEQQAQQQGIQGAIKKATEAVKEKVPQYMEQAREKTEELTGKAKEKVQEGAKGLEEEAKETAQKAEVKEKKNNK